MSFSEDFNSVSNRFDFTKDNDVQISVSQPGVYYPANYRYNFMTRTLLYSGGAGSSDIKAGVAVIPFSDLDPEVLEAMHAKLVKLGGKPPSLPENVGKRSLIDKGPRT